MFMFLYGMAKSVAFCILRHGMTQGLECIYLTNTLSQRDCRTYTGMLLFITNTP
jgi:hypothetical protein